MEGPNEAPKPVHQDNQTFLHVPRTSSFDFVNNDSKNAQLTPTGNLEGAGGPLPLEVMNFTKVEQVHSFYKSIIAFYNSEKDFDGEARNVFNDINSIQNAINVLKLQDPESRLIKELVNLKVRLEPKVVQNMN